MKGLKFTRANLDELKPADKEYFAWSQDLPGFGIRILPSGKRSWLVQFRNGEGVSCRRTIGDCRVVPITLAEARAQQLLANAKVYGVDLVQQERAEARARLLSRDRTVGAVIAAYLSESETRARRSFGEIRRYLEVAWRDVHDLDAQNVDRYALIPTLRKIASERGSVTANRAKSTLSGMFTWAIEHGVLRRDNSPTRHLPNWEEKARDTVLNIEQLALIWKSAPLINPVFGAVVQLLILSGARRGEVRNLEWGELRTWKVPPPRGRHWPSDLKSITSVIAELPSARTKTVAQFLIPLAEPAVQIINAMPRRGTARIFSGFRSWSHRESQIGPAGTAATLAAARSAEIGAHRMEGTARLRQRSLRACLGHVRRGVEGVYDRSERLYERCQLADEWAALITEAASEPPAIKAENVVPIGRAGR